MASFLNYRPNKPVKGKNPSRKMYFHKTLCTFLLLVLCSGLGVFSQLTPKIDDLDVLSYQLKLRTDMPNERFFGTVIIDFLIRPDSSEVAFDCGNLQITDVYGRNVENYEQKNQKLVIYLQNREEAENHIEITYSGRPSHGIVFIPNSQEVHTVFSTKQWMVCNDTPNDRAKFKIELSIPSDKLCVASGTLIDTSYNLDRTTYYWVQDYETPPYTYGFAIGPFNHFKETHGKISLNYYSTGYNEEELETIFLPTGEMIDFFEAKSGVPYVQPSYSQVIIGNHYQEMSGFSVLKKAYGNLVIKDSTETNLISHELAHQWWGNMITCENWNHFWLNEGLTTFLSAAFNEYKFGKEKYESDINSYKKVYESIKRQGKDKALVFSDWSNPTREDRNIVYFKGAFVLHLLRMELGEKDFWEGIKFYSQKYFGGSVNTDDFQKAIEESTGRDLSAFFARWIYGKAK